MHFYVLLILQVWILLWTMAKNSRSDDWILEQGLQPPPAKEPFYSMISFPSILLDHPPFFNSDGKEGLFGSPCKNCHLLANFKCPDSLSGEAAFCQVCIITNQLQLSQRLKAGPLIGGRGREWLVVVESLKTQGRCGISKSQLDSARILSKMALKDTDLWCLTAF